MIKDGKTKMRKGILYMFLAIILILPIGSAAEFTQVISNSEKWTDVYSAIHYANLEGAKGDFLVSTGHGNLLIEGINKNEKILVLNSEDQPYVFNYGDFIKSKGNIVYGEITSNNLNFELINRLDSLDNFIVVGDSYGYNALAVAPYAMLTRSWVFFANRLNIFQIDSLLSSRDVNNLVIYGYVDRQVSQTLSKYNPQIINSGDRFQDNVEIVKRYMATKPVKQVVLTNGEFIEKEIMAGIEPVLFTGKENVPEKINEYLKNSEIEVGVLIGNDLVGAATNIRKSAGISVMVKFARSARSQTDGVAAVEGLDLFPVPTPIMALSIYSIKYNKATSQIEITYKSDSNLPVYFKGTLTISSENENIRVGDLDPIFIAPGDFKTIVYAVNLTSTNNLKAEIYTLYGETQSSLEKILQETKEINIVDVIDSCKLSPENIKSVKYNKQKKAILVKIENTNKNDCWFDIEIRDLIIGNSKRILGTEGLVRIPSGKTKSIYLDQELTQEDLDNNPRVDLIVYSGEREDSLVNILRGKYDLDVETLTMVTYIIIAIAIIITILIIILIFLKRREKEEEYY